jgi:hypothetical protein
VLVLREHLSAGGFNLHGVQRDIHEKKIRDVKLVGELSPARLIERHGWERDEQVD